MITLDSIRRARQRISDSISPTPCARSEYFSKVCGLRAYFKLENLQMTGSFKERGALNKILSLDQDVRQRGLITASAGNHAQAVAYWAGSLDIPVVVVMPTRTPLIKVANTRGYGAEVIFWGESFDAALARAREIEQERQLTLVHAFDDLAVIAGQGTIGLELAEQVPDLEVVVVPIGGGGLISGIATALDAIKPEVRVIGVQAAAIPAMSESRRRGAPTSVGDGQTIADGIAIKQPGELTLPIVERLVDDIVTVSEDEIANAVLLLLEREKTVAEGAAATALAAVYHGKVPEASGRTTCMVLSGGNIDMNLLSRIIERGLSQDGRLVRFDVKLADRPGSLANLLQLVAEAEGNVLEVRHQRAFVELGLGEVDIELTLETRGRSHVDEIIRFIEARGFLVQAVR